MMTDSKAHSFNVYSPDLSLYNNIGLFFWFRLKIYAYSLVSSSLNTGVLSPIVSSLASSITSGLKYILRSPTDTLCSPIGVS